MAISTSKTVSLAHATRTIAQPTSMSDVAVVIGRVLFSAIFIASGPTHFAQPTISYAAQHGVPFAGLLVPASGIMALAGGLSVLLGYRARLGAVLLVLFLIPVTAMLHQFWAATDTMTFQLQFAMFMKNLGLIGGALFLASAGPGAISLDARRSATNDEELD